MSDALNNDLYLIKEHVGLFKAANNFDVHDPSTGEIIMECREPTLGVITKILRFTDYKRMTPFDVHIKTRDGKRVVRVKRGFSIFLSKVTVSDHRNKVIGSFAQKFFSIGGKFNVLDKKDQPIFQLDGRWTSWNFCFKNNNGKEFMGMTSICQLHYSVLELIN